MERVFKQVLFLTLFGAAIVFAFQAGQMGMTRSHSVSQKEKLFKSLPELTRESISAVVTENETTEANGDELNSNENDATQDEVKKEETQKEEIKSDLPKNHDHDSKKKKNKKSGSLPLGSVRFVVLGQAPAAPDQKEKKEESARPQDLPSISELYVPVYDATQLRSETQQAFQAQLSSLNAQGNIFILNRAVSVDKGKRSFEILVFDHKGQNLLGTFKSEGIFPFHGIPTLEKVDPKTFPEITGFIAVSDSNSHAQRILKDEEHVTSILAQAYLAPSLEGTFVGRDPAMNVDLYSVFPGIFFAQSLR